MGNHIYTTNKPYTFGDILQCSELCTALTDELRQHYKNSMSLAQHCEVEHCKSTNKSTICSCPSERSCECNNTNHQLQAFKLSYNFAHNGIRGKANATVDATHTLLENSWKRTGSERKIPSTTSKTTSLVPESKTHSHYTWHEHEPSTLPSRIKCEPVQLSRKSVLVKANEVYVLLHIQRKENAPGSQQATKPNTTTTTDNTQSKEKLSLQQEHLNYSPELPQPLPTQRQAREILQNNTSCKGSQLEIPAWARKISLLFTPRGVMRPFASDIQKPRVQYNKYSTSELLSAASIPSVSVSCVKTSCESNANRHTEQQNERSCVTQEEKEDDVHMYRAEYMYSIHILNGKRAHPLVSAMAVLFANELEKLLRVPFALMHLYNNTIHKLVLLHKERQKVKRATLEKSHVCSNVDNLKSSTNYNNDSNNNNNLMSMKNNNNSSQSKNVSALDSASSKGKIIDVQNTSQLANSVCNWGNNESTMRNSNSALPCLNNESSIIEREMVSARSMSALTTSFPFECSANTSSVKVERDASELHNKSKATIHVNSRTSLLQLVPVGSIICEGDNDGKNNHELQSDHTCHANATKTARSKSKNTKKKTQVNTRIDACRDELSANTHLSSQHNKEGVEHYNHPNREKITSSQVVCEEEPGNTATGSFPCAEKSALSSTPSSWEACSSICNSTASLSEPPLLQQVSSSLPSSRELEELLLHSKKELNAANSNSSKTCVYNEHQERNCAYEYTRNALLRILTNQYDKESQTSIEKPDVCNKYMNRDNNNNDDISNRNSRFNTNATELTSKAANQSTNKSLQLEQMNSSANNTTTAASSATVCNNNNLSTLSARTENATRTSFTSPRMIIQSTPRSMLSKHARVSQKGSCDGPAGVHDKANSCCILSNSNKDDNNNNNRKKSDKEIVSNSSKVMNTKEMYNSDNQHESANSKVQDANKNIRNVQGPPTLHLYHGANATTSTLPDDNSKEDKCTYNTNDESGSTATNQHNNSSLSHNDWEICSNNTRTDNESAMHFTHESNDLHNTPMTIDNREGDHSFTITGTEIVESDGQVCTRNNTEHNEEVKMHDRESKSENDNTDEDDEVRMTDDRIRKWRFASVTATEVLPYLFVGGDLPAKNKHLLLHLGITTIVNTISFEIPNSFPTLFYYDNLYVSDSPDEPIFALFPHIVRVIEDDVQNSDNDKVYIHCHQGASRSCTFVIAYLMWKNDWDYDTAYNFVRDRRNVCNPNAGFQLHLRLWRAHLKSVNLRCGFAFLPYSKEFPLPFVYQFAIIFDVPTPDDNSHNTTTANEVNETRQISTSGNMNSDVTFPESTFPNADYSEIEKMSNNNVAQPLTNVHGDSTPDETVALARPLIERNAQRVNRSHREFTLSSEICYGFVFKSLTRTHTFMYCHDSIHPSIRESAVKEWNNFVRYGISVHTKMENYESITSTTTKATELENAVLNNEKEVRSLISKELGWTESEIETAGTDSPTSPINSSSERNEKEVFTEDVLASDRTSFANETNHNNLNNESVSCVTSSYNSNNNNENTNDDSDNNRIVSRDVVTNNSSNDSVLKSYRNALLTLQKYLVEEKERLNNRDRQRRSREEFNMSNSMLTANSTSVNDTKDKLFVSNQNVLISAKDLNNKVVHDEHAYSEQTGGITRNLQQVSDSAQQVNYVNNNIKADVRTLECDVTSAQNANQLHNYVCTKGMCHNDSNVDAQLHDGSNKNEIILSSNMHNEEESKMKHTHETDINNLNENYQSDRELQPEHENALYNTERGDKTDNMINEIQVFEYPFTLPPVRRLASINDLKSSKSYVIYLPAFGELLPSKSRVYVWVGQCCNVSAQKALQTFVKNCCINHKATSKDVYSVITHSINKLIKSTEASEIGEDGMKCSNPCLEHTCTVQLPSGVVLYNATVPVIREGEEPDDLLLLFD